MGLRGGLTIVALTMAGSGALAVPGALARETLTPEGHAAEDSVAHSPSDEATLDRRTEAATAPDAAVAQVAAAAAPEVGGQWGPVEDWPVVGVHVALLPNGKVLAYDSVGDNATETYGVHDRTRATVFDPATGTHTSANFEVGFNIFCSGLAHLTDGTVFIAGGNKNAALDGIRQTFEFSDTTNAWTRTADMTAERWYPTVTPLRNGEMLITEGGNGAADTPEVRQTNGTIRRLTGAATTALPLYPWLDVAPDGRAFYSGPTQQMRTLNPDGTGAWQTYANRDSVNRDYGGHAMYDVGKILVAGGGPSTKDARVIDLNGATPSVSTTGSMASGRRQHNLTTLADGSVLATGGLSSGAGLVDLANGVYTPELWNPATGQWRTLEAQRETRQYHSTALLLPDGRVLSSGGGICGSCDEQGYLAKNGEIFTPPYLYKRDGSGQLADRPVVTGAPASSRLGDPLSLSTPQAGSIRKVALSRLGSVTHSNDMEQRYVPLAFTAGAGTLTATVPNNSNVIPPGVYMVFAIDDQGVPSVAKMIRIEPRPNAAPTASITAPANGTSYRWLQAVTINASATDSDGRVTKVEFLRANGATKLGEDTTAPYSYRWSMPPMGTHALRVRATDDKGAVTTSAPVTITVRGLF